MSKPRIGLFSIAGLSLAAVAAAALWTALTGAVWHWAPTAAGVAVLLALHRRYAGGDP